MSQNIATNLFSDTHGDGMNVRGASTMSEDEGLGGAVSESGGGDCVSQGGRGQFGAR